MSAGDGSGELKIGYRLSDVEGGVMTSEFQKWAWTDRIPIGGVTILDGEPGMGKTLLTLELAARLSRAEVWADEIEEEDGYKHGGLFFEGSYPAQAGNTVLFTTESEAQATLIPRLRAANADLARISVVTAIAAHDASWQTIYRRPRLDLSSDRRAIWEAIEEMRAKLVVFDPLADYLGPKQRLSNDQQMRDLVWLLASAASKYACAIVLIRHPTKRGAGTRLGGDASGLFTAARAGLAVIPCPEEPMRERLVIATKSNFGPPAPPLRFRITTLSDLWQEKRHPAWVDWHVVEYCGHYPCIEWLGPYKGDVGQRASPAARERQTVMGDAMAFLREALREGPRPATEVTAEAGAAGISVDALQRARARLGIRPRRAGFGRGGYWVWALSEPKAEREGEREEEMEEREDEEREDEEREDEAEGTENGVLNAEDAEDAEGAS